MCESCLEDELTRRGFLVTAAAGVGAVFLRPGRGAAAGVLVAGTAPFEAAPGLRIHRRPEWAGGLKPRGKLKPEPDARFLLVHHTAGSYGYSRSQVPSVIRSVCQYQMAAKGWADTCYNFFVDKYGGVWEGRQGSIEGPVMADATGGSQGFAQLVCLLGNFERDVPTEAMVQSLSRVLGWLGHRDDIDLNQRNRVRFVSRGSNKWRKGTKVSARPISGHRDMSYTACPGRNVYPLLAREVPTKAREFQLSISRPVQ